MKIQDFLKHHGIARNPFAEEDAQTDIVFKDHCISNTFHVGWDKVFGDPSDPATSIVFGEKGAGKTALKLQIQEHVARHNLDHPTNQLFVINYDDFNPFLDRFRDHFGTRFRRADKLLRAWRLWDHMDAILSLGITKLADQLLATGDGAVAKSDIRKLPKALRRDLLLLTACYDQSKSEALPSRWNALRRKAGFWAWKGRLPFRCGVLATILVAALFVFVKWSESGGVPEDVAGRISLPNIPYWGYLTVAGLAWLPWLVKAVRRTWLAANIARRFRVGTRYTSSLQRVLMDFSGPDLQGQPTPNKDRTDDRYELLGKFQNVLEHFGYSGILVLVDRLDEPHVVNGQAELMRAFLWPLLDNKFLKHPGIGIKMMLPIELRRFIDREDRDFYQKSRLDKQNLVRSLQWTGSALYDLASSRISAVSVSGQNPSLRSMFDESVSDQRLIESFHSLRVPRHLFKFLYRLLVAHCNSHTDENPRFEISNHDFEAVLAVYSKEIEAADAGVGV